jgi:hypothetical protein
MYSDRSTRALPRVGFPIRKSSDQRMVSSFPRLIAAAHVLHRLLAPRHPPCALRLLTRKNTFYCRYGVFKVRAGWGPPNREPPQSRNRSMSTVNEHCRGRSLKTQQRERRARRCFQASAELDGSRAITRSPPESSPRRGIPRRRPNSTARLSE